MVVYKLCGDKWKLAQRLIIGVDEGKPLRSVLPKLSQKLVVPSMKHFTVWAIDVSTKKPSYVINMDLPLHSQVVADTLYVQAQKDADPMPRFASLEDLQRAAQIGATTSPPEPPVAQPRPPPPPPESTTPRESNIIPPPPPRKEAPVTVEVKKVVVPPPPPRKEAPVAVEVKKVVVPPPPPPRKDITPTAPAPENVVIPPPPPRRSDGVAKTQQQPVVVPPRPHPQVSTAAPTAPSPQLEATAAQTKTHTLIPSQTPNVSVPPAPKAPPAVPNPIASLIGNVQKSTPLSPPPPPPAPAPQKVQLGASPPRSHRPVPELHPHSAPYYGAMLKRQLCEQFDVTVPCPAHYSDRASGDRPTRLPDTSTHFDFTGMQQRHPELAHLLQPTPPKPGDNFADLIGHTPTYREVSAMRGDEPIAPVVASTDPSPSPRAVYTRRMAYPDGDVSRYLTDREASLSRFEEAAYRDVANRRRYFAVSQSKSPMPSRRNVDTFFDPEDVDLLERVDALKDNVVHLKEKNMCSEEQHGQKNVLVAELRAWLKSEIEDKARLRQELSMTQDIAVESMVRASLSPAPNRAATTVSPSPPAQVRSAVSPSIGGRALSSEAEAAQLQAEIHYLRAEKLRRSQTQSNDRSPPPPSSLHRASVETAPALAAATVRMCPVAALPHKSNTGKQAPVMTTTELLSRQQPHRVVRASASPAPPPLIATYVDDPRRRMVLPRTEMTAVGDSDLRHQGQRQGQGFALDHTKDLMRAVRAHNYDAADSNRYDRVRSFSTNDRALDHIVRNVYGANVSNARDRKF